MPRVLFAVDEHNHVKVLKVTTIDELYVDFLKEDIDEIEYGIFCEGEDYSMGIYKGSLTWVEHTNNHPESEPDGHWEISDDFKLITDLTDEM
jgi:hypothetical protein